MGPDELLGLAAHLAALVLQLDAKKVVDELEAGSAASAAAEQPSEGSVATEARGKMNPSSPILCHARIEPGRNKKGLV